MNTDQRMVQFVVPIFFASTRIFMLILTNLPRLFARFNQFCAENDFLKPHRQTFASLCPRFRAIHFLQLCAGQYLSLSCFFIAQTRRKRNSLHTQSFSFSYLISIIKFVPWDKYSWLDKQRSHLIQNDPQTSYQLVLNTINEQIKKDRENAQNYPARARTS